jgi:hypothetical protein
MADQSNYSIEERIVMSTWVHERLNTGKTIHVLRDDFQIRFIKVAPPKMTMLRWERKIFSTGRVKDRPRSGRLPKRHEKCADVAASLLRSPKKSLRKRSSELGVPEASVRRQIKTDLGFKAFRQTSVNEVSDNDLEKETGRMCEIPWSLYHNSETRWCHFYWWMCDLSHFKKQKRLFLE